MDNLEIILNAVKLIGKDVEKETNNMLDAWAEDKDFTPQHYTISFNGNSVDIPLDFAEINNEIQEHLQNLAEAISDYIY